MIRLENINKIYHADNMDTHALSDVNLTIGKGEFVGIVGTSGSGKTTLLNILGAMDHPTSGQYFFGDTEVSGLNRTEFNRFRKENVSFVFQYFELMEQYTVYENVEMPLLAQNERHRREKVMHYLQLMHIEDLAQKRPGNLSGGQKQRCAIARALVSESNLILADEPTGALDQKTTADILDVFEDIHKSGRTIVLITHDMNVAGRCERLLRIEDGRLK